MAKWEHEDLKGNSPPPQPDLRGVNPINVERNRKFLAAVKMLLALDRDDCNELARKLLEEVKP